MEVSTLTRARLAQHQEYLRSDSEGKTGSAPAPHPTPSQSNTKANPPNLQTHTLILITIHVCLMESDISTDTKIQIQSIHSKFE